MKELMVVFQKIHGRDHEYIKIIKYKATYSINRLLNRCANSKVVLVDLEWESCNGKLATVSPLKVHQQLTKSMQAKG